MKEFEIRQLIENYYDIQKLRVETFNRIVCWVRENNEKIKKALSHPRNGTHVNYASQALIETHRKVVSHKPCETHCRNALKLLEEKKYSKFVKQFVLSQIVFESQNKVASQVSFETQISLASLFSEIEDLIWFHNKLYETEKELYKRIDSWSKSHPLRREFLDNVVGIGPVLASGLIAWLCTPILKADYVSQIWSYCGLAPNQQRKKGEKLSYNPRLKTFCWKVWNSFIKFQGFGRELYLKFKEETAEKHPDWTKFHVHNYAGRKTVKLFIAAIWEVWRKMNGLEVTEPYPIKVLGHKDRVTPEMWLRRG